MARPASFPTLAVQVFLLAAACGGRVIEDRGPANTAGSGAGVVAAGAAGDAGVVAAGRGGAAGAEASAEDAPEDVSMGLELMSLEARCVPPVSADPLDAYYGIQYANRSDERVNVIIAESQIVVQSESGELAWIFAVDQTGPRLEPEGAIGAIVSQGYRKIAGSGAGTGSAELCDYCEAQVRLEVSALVRGETVVLTLTEDRYGRPLRLPCSRDS